MFAARFSPREEITQAAVVEFGFLESLRQRVGTPGEVPKPFGGPRAIGAQRVLPDGVVCTRNLHDLPQ